MTRRTADMADRVTRGVLKADACVWAGEVRKRRRRWESWGRPFLPEVSYKVGAEGRCGSLKLSINRGACEGERNLSIFETLMRKIW